MNGNVMVHHHMHHTTYLSFSINVAKLVKFDVVKCFSSTPRHVFAPSWLCRYESKVDVSSVSFDFDMEEDDTVELAGVITRFLVTASSSPLSSLRGRLLPPPPDFFFGAKNDVIILYQ